MVMLAKNRNVVYKFLICFYEMFYHSFLWLNNYYCIVVIIITFNF